jgi:NDP-sugar pyrophosphorylase family protein
MEPRWPYLNQDNIHSQREDIQWLPIQHSIVDRKQMHIQNLSMINSIISNECNLGRNITIYNSIVGNRVTLGDNCCVQSVDFSKDVKETLRFLFCFSKILFSEFLFNNSI